MEASRSIKKYIGDSPIYIGYNQRSGEVIQDNTNLPTSINTLSHNQQLAFDIVLQHLQVQGTKYPLRMIIQGTVGTRKSYLISTIKRNYTFKQPLTITHYSSLPLLELQCLTYMKALYMQGFIFL